MVLKLKNGGSDDDSFIKIWKNTMEKNNFIFFWGHTSGPWITFSNFYQIDTKETSEKWFMLAKASLFMDHESYKKILATSLPFEAKKLGRKVKGFDPNLWDVYKIEQMMIAIHRKYEECEPFREALAKTEDKIIVEASPHDTVWGIGYDKQHALDNYSNWGQNLLGKCLMRLREEMQ